MIFSLAFTPNLCSSSIINNPKLLNTTSWLKSLCVPITISTSPCFIFLVISVCSFLVLNLFKSAILIGKSFILSANSSYCCWAKIVVGAKYATCFWSITALKAARIATSVLPYPTSPQRSLSIGLFFSISFLISSMHLNWSSVSTYGNESSNSVCHWVSFEKAYPSIFWRFAYNWIRFSATSRKLFLTRSLVLSHSLLPNLLNLVLSILPPIYFLILSKLSVGTYKISLFLYFILM